MWVSYGSDPDREAEIIENRDHDLCRVKFVNNTEDGESDIGIVDSRRLRIVGKPKVSAVTPAYAPSASEFTSSARGDMSTNVLDGRLGEICQNRMLDKFPVAYAWPALVSAAGVMVPFAEPVSSGKVLFSEPMTNLFTGLIGGVHTGKSQAILWANNIIGLDPQRYSQIRAASSEGLLKTLHAQSQKQGLPKSLLIDLDEWAFLFTKIGIQHSSFAFFLQTAFDKRSHNVILAGAFHVELTCALSFIGGIVEEQFDEIFGASSLGGLHDRFVFGLVPENYNFLYRPLEGSSEEINPIAVDIDRDVWEMIGGLRKTNPNIGREAEIAARFAHICASYDGRSVLHAKDCEKSVASFIAEQVQIRDLLKPNDGQTNDAVAANAIMEWMRRNAKPNEIIPERKIKHGLRKTLSRLGPGVLHYATQNLMKNGELLYGDIPDTKPYAGRKPKGYQLPKEQ